MDGYTIVPLMFGALLLFLMLGTPIAFGLGGISLVFGYFMWNGFASFDGFVITSYNQVTQFTLTALPLYIFMAAVLRYSDLTESMYESFYRWFGGIRGGLAVGTTIIGTLFAAMVGVSAVATATLGVTARPSMLARGYNDKLTTGIILAGSGLGILIPPSVLMIIYSVVMGVSPGAMFIAGIVPGIMMSIIIVLYSLIVCWLKPEYGPALSKEERFTWKEKFVSLKDVVLPIGIIVVVLSVIFLGVATPTEAASFGVVGSLISAGIKRKLTWDNIKKMFNMTIGVTAMVFWIVIGATSYAKIVTITRIGDGLIEIIQKMGLNAVMLLIVILILFFILGMFIDPSAILFMTGPIILPLLTHMKIDLIVFGILYIMMSCIGNLTPPFGFQLFIMKGVAPDIKTSTLYQAVWPMIGLFILGAVLIMIWPDIVTYLPNQISTVRR